MANEAVFMPVLPSFDGFFTELSKNAKKGGEQAGKDLAGAMDKSLKQAEKQVDTLAKAQERAQNRAADAADKTRIAQLRLSEAMEKGTTSASKLADLTSKYEKAQREEATAVKASEKASKDLTKAQGDLQKATDQADDAIESHTENLDGFSGSVKDAIGQIGGMVGALAGIAGAGAFAGLGKELVGETSLINMQLGHTGAAAENTSEQIRMALKSGVATGAEEAANAIGAIESQWKYLGSEGEQTAGELADNFMAFARVMEVDVAEATQTAGQLVLNGLAPDIESAADLMTAAMQRVPMQMRDEIPEIINEYGVHFAGLGLSGEEAFSMLVSASERGKWALDKTGDSLKEFQLRGSDMSKASVEAYELIGLNAEEMSNKVAAGGDGAREALERTAQGLLGIESPAERANAAIALFGTPIEDLSVDQIPSFLESLTGMEDHMAGAEGASQALADQIANSLDGRLNALKGTVQELAGDAFMWLWDTVQNQIIPGFQELGDWIQRNEAWFGPLAAAVGTAAIALGGLAAAHQIQSMWAARAAFSTTLLGRALTFLMAHPIVAAIAAIAGGLIYFFTQTETGQALWEKFTTALGDGWDWVTEKIGAGIDWIVDKWNSFTGWISDAWSGITSLFGEADYTAELGRAFGVSEDSPIIGFFFTVRDAITSAIDWVKDAWTWLGDAVSATYHNVIKPVFDGFVTAGKILFAVLATAVLTPLMIAWNALSAGVEWGYENIIKPAWERLQSAASFMWESVLQPIFGLIQTGWTLLTTAIQWYYENVLLKAWSGVQNAATWMWESVLSPVFGWIQAGWTLLADGIKWYYENVILVAWTALQNAANWLWFNVLMPIFGYIQTGWSLLADGIRWAYENVILVAWSALQAAATWMYEGVIQPVFQWIGDRWNDMSNVLHAGYEWIRDKVFGGLQAGLDVVKSAFELARDAIGQAWDGIKAKAAAPVKFVIDTVFNNGIVEAWNKVAEWVGLDPIDKYEPAWLGAYAEGTSRVPGARTKHDNVHMVSTDGKFGLSLRGGEGVVVPEVVDALGPAQIDGMNAAAKMGGTRGVLNYLGGFAGGGVIGSITDLVGRFFPGMSITSTLRPGDTGHHGSGLAVDFSNGTDSTPEMRSAAKFFHDNYGPALLELIHSPSPYNIKNGQNVGDGFGLYGAGTMNAHRNHVHIAAASPLPEPGQPITPVPSGGGGGGVINWLRNKVADAIDGIFGPIGSAIPDFGGLIGGLPKAAFEKMTGAVSSFIRGKADASGAYFGDVGAGVEQWRGLVEDVLTKKGFSTDLADTVLRRMNQESGGNPRAINNWDSNAAAGIPSKGLMQVIDPTFAAHKDAGFNDIWDPEANLRASMNYAMAQYGSLPAAYNRAGGYHDGGLAPAGQGFMAKTALEPEMVLNPAMTRAFIDWMNVSPESMSVMAQEIGTAFAGGDWGYGELASTLGNPEVAKAIVNGAAALGELSREITPILADSGKDYAKSALDLVGLGGLVEIADGVVAKVGEITSDEEFQEAAKKVQLDPEGMYSGREIARKLEELGLDVEEIKSRMGGSLLGGITAMA